MTKAQFDGLHSSSNKRENIKNKILNLFKTHYELTIPEISLLLGCKNSTVVGRVSELNDKGIIFDSGDTAKNQTIYRLVRHKDTSLIIIAQRNKAKTIKALKVIIDSNILPEAYKEQSQFQLNKLTNYGN